MKVFKKDQVGQVNPPKFDCSEDMAGLTYLNDACVLWNSVVRYKNELIYTYSGLFCIAINPYKRFPIYTQRAMEIYMGLRRQECPPHIFGVAEGSYQGMMNAGKNQSILITGESGAGKTENTKKVISYFASIGATGKKKEGEAGLEDKIVQTNPVLEAWGNAKTVRNDNSSRFGKFIRIWFNAGGKLSGADMVIYLLEKSRLTFQAELERCYHSFYNIMSDQVPDIKGKCHLSDDIYDYWWVSQGKTTVPSINSKAAADKRHIESAVHTMHAEIDDMLSQAKSSEEKAKRAMVDAARLADELRAEQDHSSGQDKAKRALETQINELEMRLAEANEVATKGGRAAMAKLESRIRELEIELGTVQSKTSETYKNFQKAERRIKELQFQQDEDHKNQDRMSELAGKLQAKIKTYKKQIEEAEEIAALNLAKYRKAQQDLEETEERVKLAGANLTVARGGSIF